MQRQRGDAGQATGAGRLLLQGPPLAREWGTAAALEAQTGGRWRTWSATTLPTVLPRSSGGPRVEGAARPRSKEGAQRRADAAAAAAAGGGGSGGAAAAGQSPRLQHVDCRGRVEDSGRIVATGGCPGARRGGLAMDAAGPETGTALGAVDREGRGGAHRLNAPRGARLPVRGMRSWDQPGASGGGGGAARVGVLRFSRGPGCRALRTPPCTHMARTCRAGRAGPGLMRCVCRAGVCSHWQAGERTTVARHSTAQPPWTTGRQPGPPPLTPLQPFVPRSAEVTVPRPH
jgi:hypothetical protein